MTYEDNLKLWKKAYTEQLKATEPYADDFASKYSYYDIRDLRDAANNHLMLIDWYEKYGLKLSHDHKPYSYSYINVRDNISFDHFRNAEKDKENGSGRYISWSDDDRQPDNEWLLNLSFSTGAYIFGDDYNGQHQLFQDFITEIKSFKPDYSDTVNHNFYWKLENAKPVFEAFDAILQKYRKLNSSELDKRKVEKLRKELKELEEGSKK